MVSFSKNRRTGNSSVLYNQEAYMFLGAVLRMVWFIERKKPQNTKTQRETGVREGSAGNWKEMSRSRGLHDSLFLRANSVDHSW